jgi:ABC-type branched-subunit amino acid transport system ATPase component
MALLELKSIVKEFPGVRALDGVSFDLQKGEVHALCGENGAGKSTLIKILCGYYPTGTYQGEILLNGQPVHFKNLRAAEEHGIALIAQELALVPELSIAENLVLGREPVRAGLIQWDRVRAEARRALALVGLDVDPDRKVKELGIGQQQMVEIAKALAKNAEILVLDEPTAALTEADAQRLLRFLSGLRAKGVSSIYISHRLERSSRSPTASRSCATGARWPRRRPRSSPPTVSSRSWWAGRSRTCTRGPRAARARRCSRWSAGRWRTRSTRAGWCCATSPSRCARARCSASPASWAPGAPRSSARSSERRAAG